MFQISDLEKAVRNHGGLGRTGKTIFGTIEHDRVVPILHSRQNSGSDSQSLSTESAFELAIRRTAMKQTGILIPGKDHLGAQVVAFAPIGAGQWGIAVQMDKSELYAPVFPHIMTTGGIISVLVLLGTLGTLLLVHPLTGKLVIHADELEQQVREKMKVIEDLYEHIVQSEKSKVLAEHTAEVAHELRQPLAIVGGFARRMARHFDSGGTFEAEQKESCHVILSEIQRLEKILDGLIDFTRRSALELERANPDEIIRKVLRVNEHRLSEKSLEVESGLGVEVEPFFLDSLRFEQVVRNLISNAIEASSPGQVITIQTCIALPKQKILRSAGLASGRHFEMKIKNSGQMIPPEDLQKIFRPFYTTKESGNGLGLTLSKKIVEDHEGSISVRSDAEGTVFTVWLPIEREPSEGSAKT
jgi:signal transduction histidine kinase